jgi:hypothetical protein
MTNHRRRWATEDIENLKRLAGKRPVTEIASELGRSRGSVAVKAHELRISLKVESNSALRHSQSSVEAVPPT